jgi:hypothetical protein
VPYVKREEYDKLLETGEALRELVSHVEGSERLGAVIDKWQSRWDKLRRSVPEPQRTRNYAVHQSS